jgi:putative membrane protein
MIRMTRPAIAGLFLIAGLAACSKSKDEYAAGTIDTAKPIGDPAMPAAVPAPVPVNDKWTSPAVIGFASAASAGEIEFGKLAQKKAMNADVKAFAKLMVTEHTTMLADTKKLATKLNILADTASDEARDLANDGRDDLKELSDKAPGVEWDQEYMDKMIKGHKRVLEKLQDAAKTTADAEVRTALEAAVGKVQTHLTKAEVIREKLK